MWRPTVCYVPLGTSSTDWPKLLSPFISSSFSKPLRTSYYYLAMTFSPEAVLPAAQQVLGLVSCFSASPGFGVATVLLRAISTDCEQIASNRVSPCWFKEDGLSLTSNSHRHRVNVNNFRIARKQCLRLRKHMGRSKSTLLTSVRLFLNSSGAFNLLAESLRSHSCQLRAGNWHISVDKRLVGQAMAASRCTVSHYFIITEQTRLTRVFLQLKAQRFLAV